ncbi:MAG: lysophospholipid acyltransferase family protein [Alphaproteobacteria bacterium]|nr:lysophospholipid acyltransferase family protein [Alphaproteobacteria bacterium]
MFKRFLDSPAGMAVLAWVAASYIRLVWATCRWELVLDPAVDRADLEARGCLFAFWHARMLLLPTAFNATTRRRLHMMISGHRDGRLVAAVIARFGLATVVGSSSRRGAGALRDMVGVIRRGDWAAITPDGPRGPRMRAQIGVAAIAQLADAPVIPVGYSTTRGRLLGSWDRMLVPFPFGRVAVVVGPPIAIAAEADEAGLETGRQAIEAALNRVTRDADNRCGRPTPEPADTGRRKG